MKKSTIALSLFALMLSVGCSDKSTQGKPAAAPAAATEPAIKASPLTKTAPTEINGSPFENAGACSLDVVNNAIIGDGVEAVAVNRANGLSVDGWALDENSAVVSPVVVLKLTKGEEQYFALLNRHGGREDLQKPYGKPEYANAGYAAPIDISSLPAGQYEVSLIQKAEGKNMVCPTKRKINLKD